MKLKRWCAARRAITELFPDRHAQQIKCYAIASGDPTAVIIQSPDWRLKLTSDDLELVQGQIDPDHLSRLKRVIASNMGLTEDPTVESDSSPELDDETPGIEW